jgi:lipopolysaccharide biosynthesis glycosyltransferase
MMTEIKVFIGYDGREKVAYEVLRHSIEKNTHSNVKIIPLYHKELRKQGFFQRPWHTEALTGNQIDQMDGRPFSTEFSHSRFLIPELMKFKGWALFMDCDMLMRCDVKEIFDLCDERYAVMCVKHRQEVKKSTKMDGSPQTAYFRKNWSSFMLINCGHEANRQLTRDAVNTRSGGWLHSFSWLDERQIGSLPDYYNWIEGTSRGMEYPRVIHYTEGGPWFHGKKDVMYGDVWEEQYASMMEMLPEPSDQLLQVDYASI